MTLGFILAVLGGTVAASFVSGLSGFAFGMVALSVWAWTLEPRLLAPLVVAGSLATQLISFGAVRRGLLWRKLLPFLIGGALGVPFGTALLGTIDLALFRGLTGGLLIVFCSMSLAMRELPPLTHGGRLADAIVGVGAGTMAGLAGLPGPLPVLWCSLRRWDRDVQRAVFQAFNTAMHAITLASYAWRGLLTAEVGWAFAVMLPALLVPTWLGAKLYGRISEPAFRRLILVLLLASGCVLVGSSLLGRDRQMAI